MDIAGQTEAPLADAILLCKFEAQGIGNVIKLLGEFSGYPFTSEEQEDCQAAHLFLHGLLDKFLQNFTCLFHINSKLLLFPTSSFFHCLQNKQEIIFTYLSLQPQK